MKIYIHNTCPSPEGESYRQRLRMMASESASGQIVFTLADCDICLIIGSQFHNDLWLPMLEFAAVNRTVPVAVLNEQDNPIPVFSGLYASVTDNQVTKGIRSIPYSCLNNDVHVSPSANACPMYLYSFIGSLTHPCRKSIFEIDDDRAKIVEAYGGWSRQSQGDNLKSYKQTMLDSKFVLCPRGLGPSSFRLYEAIATGRVPVVISDQWAPPAGIPWDKFSLRVRESEANLLPDIMRDNEHRYDELQENVKLVHRELLSDCSLFDYYVSELESMTLGRMRQKNYNDLLLKHVLHKVMRKANLSALLRRVGMVK